MTQGNGEVTLQTILDEGVLAQSSLQIAADAAEFNRCPVSPKLAKAKTDALTYLVTRAVAEDKVRLRHFGETASVAAIVHPSAVAPRFIERLIDKCSVSVGPVKSGGLAALLTLLIMVMVATSYLKSHRERMDQNEIAQIYTMAIEKALREIQTRDRSIKITGERIDKNNPERKEGG